MTPPKTGSPSLPSATALLARVVLAAAPLAGLAGCTSYASVDHEAYGHPIGLTHPITHGFEAEHRVREEVRNLARVRSGVAEIAVDGAFLSIRPKPGARQAVDEGALAEICLEADRDGDRFVTAAEVEALVGRLLEQNGYKVTGYDGGERVLARAPDAFPVPDGYRAAPDVAAYLAHVAGVVHGDVEVVVDKGLAQIRAGLHPLDVDREALARLYREADADADHDVSPTEAEVARDRILEQRGYTVRYPVPRGYEVEEDQGAETLAHLAGLQLGAVEVVFRRGHPTLVRGSLDIRDLDPAALERVYIAADRDVDRALDSGEVEAALEGALLGDAYYIHIFPVADGFVAEGPVRWVLAKAAGLRSNDFDWATQTFRDGFDPHADLGDSRLLESIYARADTSGDHVVTAAEAEAFFSEEVAERNR